MRLAPVLALITLVVTSACFTLGGPMRERDSFWLLITNDMADPIVVRPEAPISNPGAWTIQPGDEGPYVYARAGTWVDILTEDCRVIGQIPLPTVFNSGEPEYTVRADGVIERHDNPLAHLGDIPLQALPGKPLCP